MTSGDTLPIPTMHDLFGEESEEEVLSENAVTGVQGLFLIKGFLSTEEQGRLETAIEKMYHFTADEEQNQVLLAHLCMPVMLNITHVLMYSCTYVLSSFCFWRRWRGAAYRHGLSSWEI